MSFGFLVINVCDHGEDYETPCTRLRHGAVSVGNYFLEVSNNRNTFTLGAKYPYIILPSWTS